MKLGYRTHKNAEAVSRIWGKSLDRPDWYKVEASSDSDNTEIILYDVIGWPFNDAGEFIRALSDIRTKTITVRINSPGGDVFDGLAIFNALQGHSSKIITRIDSLAASMASVIALGGRVVQAYANAMYMIHDPWALVSGNFYDLREVSDLLEKISGNIVDIYAKESSIGKRELKDMMKAETWFTAKEAKERGLIDTILDGKGAKAQFDLSVFSNAPDTLVAAREGRDLTEREIERALRDAGASRTFAKETAHAAGCSGGIGGNLREAEDHTIKCLRTLTKIIHTEARA